MKKEVQIIVADKWYDIINKEHYVKYETIEFQIGWRYFIIGVLVTLIIVFIWSHHG